MAATIDIVVPVYNEEAVVTELVERLGRACPDAKLFFVDNASTDRTVEILERLEAGTLICHGSNLGYGQSLRDGIAAGKGEFIVMIDADLEYHPEDIPALVEALERHRAVYGSRWRKTPAPLVPWLRRLGNRLVSGLFNRLFRQEVSDLYTGIRAVRRSALPPRLNRAGFEYVLELAAALARSGVPIGEVPVGYTPRTQGQSKMRHVPEFLKFAWCLVRFRMSRHR